MSYYECRNGHNMTGQITCPICSERVYYEDGVHFTNEVKLSDDEIDSEIEMEEVIKNNE